MSAIHVLNFISKFISNKRVTAYQIAIPLDFKVTINSSVGDMSGKRRLVKHHNSICPQKIDSEAGMSWGIVMLVHKVSSPLILTQKG